MCACQVRNWVLIDGTAGTFTRRAIGQHVAARHKSLQENFQEESRCQNLSDFSLCAKKLVFFCFKTFFF